MMGDIKGLDSIKAELAKFHSFTPDMKIEAIKVLADSEYVFQWVRFTGTVATADMGMKPGTKIDISPIELANFNSEGKITEHWEFMTSSDAKKMRPPMDMGKKMDSTMHK